MTAGCPACAGYTHAHHAALDKAGAEHRAALQRMYARDNADVHPWQQVLGQWDGPRDPATWSPA